MSVPRIVRFRETKKESGFCWCCSNDEASKELQKEVVVKSALEKRINDTVLSNNFPIRVREKKKKKNTTISGEMMIPSRSARRMDSPSRSLAGWWGALSPRGLSSCDPSSPFHLCEKKVQQKP